MIEVVLTEPIPLSLTLDQLAASGLFPRAVIYDVADAVAATRDLTEVGSTGRYTDTGYTPVAEGIYHAHFIVYTDSGHTTESAVYSRAEETFSVRTADLLQTVDGTVTKGDALANSNAYAKNKINRTGDDFAYRNDADTLDLFTNQKTDAARLPI